MRIQTSIIFSSICVLVSLARINGFYARMIRIRKSEFSASDAPLDENQISTESARLAPKIADSVQEWLFSEPLQDIIPRESLSSALKELQGNSAFWEANKSLYEKWWLQFENTVRNEQKSLKDILGSSNVLELLNSVEKADVYDPVTVRSFLGNPAFETMIGGILYEGIFEFIQRVDIIGNIVNKLPIIGPIRQTIMSEFKKSLDKTLGGQVKTFLSSFNRIAVQRMIEFILSPSNRLSLQKANRNLVESLLERPFSSIVPGKETTLMLRDQLWMALRETPTSEAVSIVDLLYDQVGSKTVTDFADAQELLEAMPSAKKLIQNNVARFLDTEKGSALLLDMMKQ